jgi:hypothetical protein
VVPALEGPRRFHARVAANVVGIVAREIARGDSDLRAEWAGLAALLGREGQVPADSAALSTAVRDGTSELVERIRAGEADAGPFRDAVIAHLERTVAAKLAVAERPRKGT